MSNLENAASFAVAFVAQLLVIATAASVVA